VVNWLGEWALQDGKCFASIESSVPLAKLCGVNSEAKGILFTVRQSVENVDYSGKKDRIDQ
jgi:hypothetical protein